MYKSDVPEERCKVPTRMKPSKVDLVDISRHVPDLNATTQPAQDNDTMLCLDSMAANVVNLRPCSERHYHDPIGSGTNNARLGSNLLHAISFKE